MNKSVRITKADQQARVVCLEDKGMNFSEVVNELFDRQDILDQVIASIQTKPIITDEWYTPKYVVDFWRSKGWNFQLDISTNKEQAEYLEIPNYYTIEQNSLSQDWNEIDGDFWGNIPYSKTYYFLAKARETLKANPNKRILFFIPFKPDQKYWEKFIDGRAKIYLPKGKTKFINKEKEHTCYGGSTKLVFVELTSYECDEISYVNIEEPKEVEND